MSVTPSKTGIDGFFNKDAFPCNVGGSDYIVLSITVSVSKNQSIGCPPPFDHFWKQIQSIFSQMHLRFVTVRAKRLRG